MRICAIAIFVFICFLHLSPASGTEEADAIQACKEFYDAANKADPSALKVDVAKQSCELGARSPAYWACARLIFDAGNSWTYSLRQCEDVK